MCTVVSGIIEVLLYWKEKKRRKKIDSINLLSLGHFMIYWADIFVSLSDFIVLQLSHSERFQDRMK